jgi:hypothetical protein
MTVRRLLQLPLPELRDCRRCACVAVMATMALYCDYADVCFHTASLCSWRHNLLRDDGVLAPCRKVGTPAYREEPAIVDGIRDRPADAWMLGVEPESEPTQSELCADVTMVARITEHLASGADLPPGAALAAGFTRNLGNVQKLASERMILLPFVASSLGGFHIAWAHLYQSLAER